MKTAKNGHFLSFWTFLVHKNIFYFTESPPKHSRYTAISSKASKMSIQPQSGDLQLHKTLFQGLFLLKNAVFQDLDPILRIKSVMNVQNQLKLKVQILTLLKYFTPLPLCILEPRNSHFSLIWF